jgi:hypothetical protein
MLAGVYHASQELCLLVGATVTEHDASYIYVSGFEVFSDKEPF